VGQRLRLTAHARDTVAKWRARDGVEQRHRERLAQVLTSFDDGIWQGRWWCAEHPADSRLLQLRPGEGLLLLFRLLYDSDQPGSWADIVAIDHDDAYDQPPLDQDDLWPR